MEPRTATETMAIVLFICVLGQPLVLAHLDGFTAVHPLVTSSVHVWITEPPVRCVLYIHFFPYNVTDARMTILYGS